MMTTQRRCPTITLVVLSIAALSTALTAGGQQGSLPALLDSFLLNEAHGSASDRAALVAGEPVVKLLDSDPSREVGVFGAIWVDAPSALYVEQAKNIEQFEQGEAFHITKRISDPPRAEDFSRMEIPEQDFKELKDCKLDDCTLKLAADAVERIRSEVHWDRPTAKAEASAVFRELALEYVNGYRGGGNTRLAVYRDKAHPTFVADEFRSMIDRLPRLTTDLPDLKRFLLEYPKVTLPHATDLLYWQETQFGLKPTLRISHLMIQPGIEQTVVASKMLYASHYFWTALEIRVLLPDPARGRGFWFATVNRSRSDGLAGFTGRVIRGRLRTEVEDGTRAALIATRSKLESVAR